VAHASSSTTPSRSASTRNESRSRLCGSRGGERLQHLQVDASVCVCVRVCVRERARERTRDRERDREGEGWYRRVAWTRLSHPRSAAISRLPATPHAISPACHQPSAACLPPGYERHACPPRVGQVMSPHRVGQVTELEGNVSLPGPPPPEPLLPPLRCPLLLQISGLRVEG